MVVGQLKKRQRGLKVGYLYIKMYILTVIRIAFFLDVKKAYDTVWRNGLWYRMWEMGI